jgi:CubicO group peptidase (beta-lactamase class C family)
MTKPITSVAAMICCEEGLVALDDPLSKFIPDFAETRVYTGGSPDEPETAPMKAPITIWNLMTHTAGLTYGWMFNHPVDAIYRTAGFGWGTPHDLDLAGCCSRLARLPLRCQPGTQWNYSVATDVLGRVVEVATGQSLDRFFADRIFGPLGMRETVFYVDGEAAEKLAVLYVPDFATGRATRSAYANEVALHPPRVLLGGSELVSTAADYHLFTQALLGGGELGGTRILAAPAVGEMTRNQLPAGADLADFGNPTAGQSWPGLGFGLGFSVVIDPKATTVACNVGEYGWGGAASTDFWVDPSEELTVLFFTQLFQSTGYTIRRDLKRLVHSSIRS